MREKREKEKKERENYSGLFGFSKPEFISFSNFWISTSFLHNFGHDFYF